MFNNAHTIEISHYCIFSETLPRPIHCGFRLLSSLPRSRFSSHCGEFVATTFGKDEVLPRANGPIVLSGIVLNPIATLAQLPYGVGKTGGSIGKKKLTKE